MTRTRDCQGANCNADGCRSCCMHDERDHWICLDCGDEQDPGEAIDRAQAMLEDR